VLDREGRLLRAYATPDGYWRLPVAVEDVDPRFFKLLFAYEDKRFREHHGVDPQAMLRAASQFLWNGRIVSGASTLTMQVARLLEPRPERTMLAKLRQMTRALELEQLLSKDEILGLYFSLAPYGGNLEGIRAASLAYFGREPRRLTVVPTAIAQRRSEPATVCSTGSWRRVRFQRTRQRAPKRSRCRARASRCRCSRRMRPTR
jgi:penicillin-binding protein 1C